MQVKYSSFLISFFLITFLLLGFTGFSQKTHIPDANFRKFLLDRHNIVSQNDSILNSDVVNIISLHVLGRRISSLSGIEAFISLTSLRCYGSRLRSLDVSANTALIELFCYSNRLTSLDVSANTALIELSCYNNRLTSLDISANTKLTYLYCYSNQLTGLDVSTNTELTSLDCYSNQLTSLDVSTNTELTYLDCHSNQLTSLGVSTNTELTYLYCYSNQLTSLDVSANEYLTALWCYNNQLTSLDVSANEYLTALECYNNQLTYLNIKNEYNDLLSIFRVSGNPNLTCIQVDNSAWNTSNWTSNKDEQHYFSEDCSTASNEDFELSGIFISPNPTGGILNINIDEKADYSLLNIRGQVLKTGVLAEGDSKIDISFLSKGIYLLNIKTSNGSFIEKIVRK